MRISVEETRNCHTVQCILPTAAGWKPSPDDLDIEGESGHYLTGVADHMPSGGFGLECAPVRHGADYIQAETNFLLDEVCTDFSLPQSLALHLLVRFN
jgi:hypothetical protein